MGGRHGDEIDTSSLKVWASVSWREESSTAIWQHMTGLAFAGLSTTHRSRNDLLNTGAQQRVMSSPHSAKTAVLAGKAEAVVK
ncbi:hypothetical protein HYFRA_00013025 [Hymenoscyphus fraxineus]|uniref:Uncharacterized protein n=1 Tax=Hymenoscyphus fraxineus TaxID=746836 RepID=A0A9N9L5Z5_9HELO|nr:hypothetical protein HYFRA_00013025 [Hymenoscyphus fraxineus]